MLPGMNKTDGGKKLWIERLFTAHGAALQRFFRRRIREAPDAPDLAQEVYVRMLRVSDSDAIRDPELYLFTVANNLVREHALVEKRRRACDDIDDEAIQEQLAELPQLDGEIDTMRRTERLREVFEQLSPKCRATLILQYRDELSYQQIAERLGISTHTVKKYVMQGLELCRRRMERLR
jgi:RNA polymerase sigma factor (sigma-70 family)